jgi:outer membrane protein assembly factor BamE (lipoprotein component of BamABCDE complex)
MKKILIAVFSLCLSVLAGCSTTTVGKKVDDSQISSFKKGTTTYDQVVEALGKPKTVAEDSETLTLTYVFFSYSTNQIGMVLIPVVGPLLGSSAQTDSQEVTFKFNSKTKILKDYTKSASTANYDTGFFKDSK